MKSKLLQAILKSFQQLIRLPLTFTNGGFITKVILNLFQDLTTVLKAVRLRIVYARAPIFREGFTLIEILVVVLIIGILGAIMLPQYQRAVLKSRFAALMPIAKSMADSNEAYYLEHGIYADNAEDLPVQGRRNYSDGTELEFGTTTSHAYVLATRDNDFPNNYIVYQKHSEQYPGEIHCEAATDNAQAQEVCKSFGATEDIGQTLTPNYLTYVLFGTGNGEPPTGDEGGDNNSAEEEPETPTIDEETLSKLESVAANKCSTNQPNYVCTIQSNGTVSQCYTDRAVVTSDGECIPTSSAGEYEIVFDADGNKIQAYQCKSINSDGNCTRSVLTNYKGDGTRTYKERECSGQAAISKEGVCPNGKYYTPVCKDEIYTSSNSLIVSNNCSQVAPDGTCTEYNKMYAYDRITSPNTLNTTKYCTSISSTSCEKYQSMEAYYYQSSNGYNSLVACMDSSRSTALTINADGSCPSNYTWTQRYYNPSTKKTLYKECSNYSSISWEHASC